MLRPVAMMWVLVLSLAVPRSFARAQTIAEAEPAWPGGGLLARLAPEPREFPMDEPMATDRPDFTEASSTVGRHVMQLEMGYTYSYFDDDRAGVVAQTHSGPEILLRVGVVDRVELRVVWNYLWTQEQEGGTHVQHDGAEDLVLGTKLGLTRQLDWLPESALVLQLGVPTGANEYTNHHAEFGLNYLYGWDLTDVWSMGGSTGWETAGALASAVLPGSPGAVLDRHNVVHQSMTVGRSFTDDLKGYFEYFGLYPHGSEDTRPLHFLDGGFTYLLSADTQLDIRAGKGLSEPSDDFFVGTGISLRR